MLFGERDADDGDKEECAEKEMAQRNPNTADQDPDHVENNIQASIGPIVSHYFFTERPKSQSCHLDRLQAEGNADDGNHHKDAADQVLNGNKYSAKNEPNDIAEKSHECENSDMNSWGLLKNHSVDFYFIFAASIQPCPREQKPT
jgi:hypothetical protein